MREYGLHFVLIVSAFRYKLLLMYKLSASYKLSHHVCIVCLILLVGYYNQKSPASGG